MKLFRHLAPLSAVLLLSSAARAASAPPPDSFEVPTQDSAAAAWWRDSGQTRDARLAWWREARFGMFVHWGVYSHLGNEYHGRKGGGYAEHIQRVLKIPIPEYRAEVAGHFNPVGFDADAWIRQARDAGMGYFVITAKHHDGFAMWPSRVNRANVMDATPWRHDPMADLRAACRKYGVKFGFYYSHAFDWGEADGPGNDWDFSNPGGDTLIGGRDWWQTTPAFLPRAKRYVDEKSIPQLRELIAHYDPDILWFDTPHKLPPAENVRIMRAVREASPRVVINGRIVRGWGDYDSTADRPAEFSPHEGDWEGIPTTNESYGWSKFDDSHKPPAHFIRLLAKAAARGGNLLMNLGPMGDGRFDPRDTAILSGIGTWWKLNGESIRGTERTPLPVQTWGESTRKGNRLYLHVFQWPTDGRLVIGGLKSEVKSAWLLAGAPDHPLTSSRLNALDVCLAVPAAAPDAADSVVVLECVTAPVADVTRLLQPAFATETLRSFDGELRGGLRFGAGKKTDDWATNWTRADDQVAWSVRLNEPASYDVVINYDAPSASAGGAYTVSLGSQALNGTVQAGNNQNAALGRVALEPGRFEIRVTAREIKGGELFRLRRVELRAAQAVGSAAARPQLPQSKPPARDATTVAAEHSDIGVVEDKGSPAVHTLHPDAQWYPEAGFGLFIHWGISSVRAMNISWPMIPGRPLATKRITDPAERERIIREGDYNLNGKPNSITPNEYFSMAKDFNPQRYDPDRWLAAAKAAGFAYVVLTTKHHEGFALWPSAHGDFDTRNFMGGRDLLKPYVEACRKHGLKVGFYYSPPDWYFDRDFKNFIYGRGAKNNPELPAVGPDLKPRTVKPSETALAAHRAAYVAKVNGQVEELLTRYGKIDVLWFDGRPEGSDASTCISQERIRELQPGIVINPRLHGRGDFITYERTLGTAKVATGWAEFCNTWTTGWSHQEIPFRAPGFVLGQLAACRSLHVNYLLGVGPMATGEFCDGIYQNMAIVSDWMKTHRSAVTGTKPLPPGESASVPATASGPNRYLFALPQFKPGGTYEKDLLPAADATLTLTGIAKPAAVSLLGNRGALSYEYRGTTLTVQLPATKRSQLVDVVRVELPAAR